MHRKIEELNEFSLIDNSSPLTREEMKSLLMHGLENIYATPYCSIVHNYCGFQRNDTQYSSSCCNCCTTLTKSNKKSKENIENNDGDDLCRLICGNKHCLCTINEIKMQLHYDKILSRYTNITTNY